MSSFLCRSPPDSYNITQGVILILQKMTSHVFTFRIPRKNKLIQQIQWKQIHSRSVFCAILVFVSFVFYSFPHTQYFHCKHCVILILQK